jgi:hypothetical protein
MDSRKMTRPNRGLLDLEPLSDAKLQAIAGGEVSTSPSDPLMMAEESPVAQPVNLVNPSNPGGGTVTVGTIGT